MKFQAALLIAILTFGFCQGQKLNKIYYGISSDSLYNAHQLEFMTDTTIEISTFPRHMSKQFKVMLKYKKAGNTINVFSKLISRIDSTELANHGLTQFINGELFIVDKRALIDTSIKMVYVLFKDFSKRTYLTYIIDGKTFKLETGIPDAYGLINSNPKENVALKEKLSSLNQSMNNYTIKVYKGLDAYNKFGYDSVFGVIELRQKN